MAQDDVERQWRVYESRASMAGEGQPAPASPPEPVAASAMLATKGGDDE